ncbi:MAG: hypothetical protein L6R41_001448 [Letrouitia leprolyta]|nr:MAG: hypothetical protein L6R41_001448 [Letrouitia leprolyta]
MARFSGLSLRDWPSSSPSTSPSSLERIPSEILNLIAENLAFWDKKALASASRRIYHLLGSVEPPDRFSWRVHMLTSFNRAPNEFFDVTIVQSDDIQQELTRLVKQLPETLKRGHYAFDPAKTRLKDLSCLYFPDGFYTGFGGRMIRCRTLGQFIAIQINEYIGRLLLEAKRGASFTLLKRDLKTSTNIGFEKGTEPSTIASKWRETYESWIFGKRWSEVKRLSSAAPAHSAWEQSLELLLRMGFHIVHGRICFKGKICEVGSDEGVQIRAKIRHKKRRLDCDPSDDDTDDDDGEICYCLNPTNEGPGGGFDFCRADENEDIGAQESNYFNDAMYFHGGQVVDDTRFGSPEI